MIGGNKDSIVLGYLFPALNPVTVGPLFVNPPTAPPESGNSLTLEVFGPKLGSWQTAVVTALKELRKEERTAKEDLEIAKNKKMEELKTEAERREYLQDEYVPKLRRLGQSEPKVKGLIDAKIDKFNAWLKTFANNIDGAYHLRWAAPDADGSLAVQAVRSAPPAADVTVPVVVLLFGEAAYTPVVVEGARRQVYLRRLDKKLLQTDADKTGFLNKYYVKDDRGVFTRRIAYGAKGLANCARLFVKGVLQGKYVREGGTYDAADDFLEQQIPSLASGTTLNTEELLYVNQELGSGHQQRGICLASTSKLIHSNQGVPFKTAESLTLTVDLAKVPTGANLLFNLYSQEAQLLTIGMNHWRDGKKHSIAESKEHTDWSTAKNRELFLKELKWDYLTEGCKASVKSTLQTKLSGKPLALGNENKKLVGNVLDKLSRRQ
jgi:hypothetical protein